MKDEDEEREDEDEEREDEDEESEDEDEESEDERVARAFRPCSCYFTFVFDKSTALIAQVN